MRGYEEDGLGGGNEHVVKKLIRDEFFDFKEKLVDGEAGSDVLGYPEPPLQSPLHKPKYMSLPKPRYKGTVAKIVQYLIILIMSLGEFDIKHMIHNGDKRPGIIKLPWDTGEARLEILELPSDTGEDKSTSPWM